MQFGMKWVNVDPYLAQGVQPQIVLQRERMAQPPGGSLRVPLSPLNNGKIYWATVKSSDYVRVPMHAYRTADDKLPAILMSGMELGIRVADAFWQEFHCPPSGVWLVLGDTCHWVEEASCHRCYVGLAIDVRQ